MESLVGTLGGLVAFFGALLALDLAAMRWGVDSRHPDIGCSLFQRQWKEACTDPNRA